DEAKYKKMNPLNPHLCGPKGWKNIFAGDKIYFPREWLPKLTDKYEIHEPPAAEKSPGPDPIPGLAYFGCKDRHLETPLAEHPDRRGEKRTVEVIFLDGPAPAVCKGDGPCGGGHCELYDPRAFDLKIVPIWDADAEYPLELIVHDRTIDEAMVD